MPFPLTTGTLFGLESPKESTMQPRDMSIQYTGQPLLESTADPDPMRQFEQWYSDAALADRRIANAMTLSTVTATGQPTSRVVLLKGIEADGFVFYTNYTSDKGDDLAHDSRAALTFWWPALHRQVRIEGVTSKVTREASLAYFRTRPRGSQIGALASQQSQVLPGREALDRVAAEIAEKYEGKDIPMPDDWGGYHLLPTKIEFWQGRPDRLHDRLRYRPPGNLNTTGAKTSGGSGGWVIERLAP